MEESISISFKSSITYIEEIYKTYHPIFLLTIIFGLFYLLKQSLSIIYFIYRYFIRKPINLERRYGKGWAIITGGSSGIGLAYAHQLAAKGYNSILISNEEMGEVEAQNIINKYGVKSKAIYFDLNIGSGSEYSHLLHTIMDIVHQERISFLINNVGMYGISNFHEYKLSTLESYHNLNTGAATHMTRLLIPHILQSTPPKIYKTCIIFISSGTKSCKFPFVSTYSATKSYIHALANSIAMEYKEELDVLCLYPGAINTRLNPGEGAFFISPEGAVSSHLRSVGRERNGYGHWKHELSDILFSYVPETLMIKLMLKVKKDGERRRNNNA